MSLTADIAQGEDLEISPELRAIVDNVVLWEELESNHFIRMVEQGRLGKNVGWGNGSSGSTIICTVHIVDGTTSLERIAVSVRQPMPTSLTCWSNMNMRRRMVRSGTVAITHL